MKPLHECTVHTRSLPSYSLSKLFLISARNGVSSFTPWFSTARSSFHSVRFSSATLYLDQGFSGAAHSVEEFARRVDRHYFGCESEKIHIQIQLHAM